MPNLYRLKKIPSLFSLLVIIVGLGIGVSLIKKPQEIREKAQVIEEKNILGKGVIYYTENYIRDYSGVNSKYNIPVPDSHVDGYDRLYTEGVQCSRYIDMTMDQVDQFVDLNLDFVILGFGPASWYYLAPEKPADATNFRDPAYQFDILDKWIGMLQKVGITPVLQLWGTPTWASRRLAPTKTPFAPIVNVSEAYYGNAGKGTDYTVVKGDSYWYSTDKNSRWYSNTLQSAYYTSPNAAQVGVPTSDIDTAYFDANGNYTVIKGNRYWYRTSSTTNWYSNTLQSAYFTSPNAASIGVPTADIDAAYFDANGNYTVIKGNRYWYRTSSTTNWYSNTLQSAYYTSPNAAQVGVPISDIDAAYYGNWNGNPEVYTIVKGDKYWFRTATTFNWSTDTLNNAYYNQINNCQTNQYSGFEPYNYAPANVQDYADFVTAVVRRYNGSNIDNPIGSGKLLVRIFSIWNEANLKDFWDEGSSYPDKFFSLHQKAYLAIKSARPDSEVWGINMVGSVGDPEYFVNQMCSNKPDFDVFAYHPYPQNFNLGPSEQPNTYYNIGNISKLVDKLRGCSGYENKPIALTEIGYRNDIESDVFGISGVTVSAQTKADYLQQSLELINQVNSNPNSKIIAVANNTLHNAWRWWFTGLINIYPFRGTTSQPLVEKDSAYDVFKNWRLSPLPTPIHTPAPTTPPIPSPTDVPTSIPTPTPTDIPTPTPTKKPSPTTIPTITPTSGCQPGTVPGDANGDCSVDGFDYVVWWQNFGNNVSGGYTQGDFNGNGNVDGFDYVIWWQNFGS